MTVRQFLHKFMVGASTIENVSFRMDGTELKRIGKRAIQEEDYFGFGNDVLISFKVRDNLMILNLKPTY